MTTPRDSTSGAFPAGSIAMQPVQKLIPRRVPSVLGATQSFFMRESKALGAVQIMNGLFHIALGGLLLLHAEVYAPICVTLWYPLWGGIMPMFEGSAYDTPAQPMFEGSAYDTPAQPMFEGSAYDTPAQHFFYISSLIIAINAT